MNYRIVFRTLGKVMLIATAVLLIPFFVGVGYGETEVYLSFLVPMAILLALGLPLSFIKVKDKAIFAKEGFVIVSLCWIMLALIGALPFVLSGTITNYIDAVFETVSGLTTTGASVLSPSAVDSMYAGHKGIMFWRMFTHWIGGMGVLVFVLAVFPSLGDGAIHLYKAEAPGPDSSKLVSKIVHTARILYSIYIGLTVVQIIMLLCSGVMPLYDCVAYSFSTAGTGGFALSGAGVSQYNSVYCEMVMAVFMFLFGINFNIYYFILIGAVSKVFRNEELRTYLIIVIVATLIVAINLLSITANFGEALRYAFFQTASISSTTGLATANFDGWPALSKSVLMILMMFGACGGSTAGGMKISRLVILCKSGFYDIKKMVHPRAVYTIKLDGTPIGKETERNARSYLVVWFVIVLVSTLLVSTDSYCGGNLMTSFSGTLACIGNVGPGFAGVGPALSYGGFNAFSKLVLSFVMLIGRLEIFPLIVLFSPRTWRRAG